MSASGFSQSRRGRVIAWAALAAASFLLPAVAGAAAVDSGLASSPTSIAAPPSVDPAYAFLHQAFGGPSEKNAADDSAPSDAKTDTLFLDAAPPAEQPNIHGFFTSPFKTAYVTPRGLVVQNAGLVWQPVVGLVFPIGDFGPVKNVTFVGGLWNSVDTAEHDTFVGPWDEMDVFISVSGTIADKFSLTATYSPWNSPQHAFRTEHNIDLKIAYDDSKMWGTSGVSLNPYVDLFWAVAGDSTVILGSKGGTGYFEPGIVPTYTLKMKPDYPLTLTFPMYVQIGPSNYWDAAHTYGNSDFGLFSVGANVSVPLAFIPARFGHWHGDLGVTYDYLINNALLHAGGLASGNTNHNVIVGSIGFGLNF